MSSTVSSRQKVQKGQAFIHFPLPQAPAMFPELRPGLLSNRLTALIVKQGFDTNGHVSHPQVCALRMAAGVLGDF